jgi:mRNA interferase MazF
MKYYKDHNEWNRLKKILDGLDIPIKCDEGEVWWASLGTNIGIEIDGKGDDFARPVLIVKKFNEQHVWVVPLSRKLLGRLFMRIKLDHRLLENNTSAIITQLQTISSKRLLLCVCTLPIDQFRNVTNAIIKILTWNNKRSGI